MTSQNDAILAWLKSGERIDPMLALRAFGCARLAARISNLRECGHRIESTRRQNGKKFWAEYQLSKENDNEMDGTGSNLNAVPRVLHSDQTLRSPVVSTTLDDAG